MSLFGQLKDVVSAPLSRVRKHSMFVTQPAFATVAAAEEAPLKGGPVKEFPFRYSVGLSFVLHVLGPILFWVLLVVLLLLPLFPKQQAETPAIEFVLVPRADEQAPENAKFLGEQNQLAGGKQENEPVPFETESATSARSQESQPSPARPSPAPSEQVSPTVQPSPQQTSAKPQPSPPKPKVRPTQAAAPKPAITTPKPPEPKRESLVKPASVDGPIASTTNPSPALQGGTGPATPSTQASQALASAGRQGLIPNMNRGSAEAGPSSRDGVSVKSADFGPYMAELKRRLSRNWRPPRGEDTRRVVLKFEIARDGTLKSLAVDESSGEKVSDQAAINAVEISAPFRPLPPSFSGDSVPILFTFDYTVYGASRN